MGGPPDLGEDQETTVTVSGPEKGTPKGEKDAFDAEWADFKKQVRDLRKKYPRLKFRVTKVALRKKDPNDSFNQGQ